MVKNLNQIDLCKESLSVHVQDLKHKAARSLATRKADAQIIVHEAAEINEFVFKQDRVREPIHCKITGWVIGHFEHILQFHHTHVRKLIGLVYRV